MVAQINLKMYPCLNLNQKIDYRLKIKSLKFSPLQTDIFRFPSPSEKVPQADEDGEGRCQRQMGEAKNQDLIQYFAIMKELLKPTK